LLPDGVHPAVFSVEPKGSFYMIKRMLLGLVTGCCFLSVGAVARAEEDRPAQPYVVLVGIDQYQDPQIKTRKHAEADAKALYDLFTSKQHLGVGPKHIKLLLGTPDKTRPSQPATRANIMKALQWLEKTTTRDDLVIFAYLGNGAPLGERSCYFAVDSTFKNRAKDAVASGDIENAVDHLQSQKFVALIDVNFLGFDSGKEDQAPDPNLQNFYKEFLNQDEAKVVAPSQVVFLPNSGLKPSLDLAKHGVFTQALLNGLKGEADSEGYEADGNITINELIKFFRKELHELALEHGKFDEEKAQTPAVLEGHTQDFIVGLNPAAYPKAQQRLAKFDKLARDQSLEKNIAEEGHNLLSRMPKLEAQQTLRKAYQKLVDGKSDVTAFLDERKDILEETKLSSKDADQYALMVMRAVKMVRDGYVKDTNAGAMTADAVRGMYKSLNEKVPSAIKDRLDNAKTLKEVDLVKLLAESRKHLGKREDLAEGNDITLSLHAMLAKLDKHTDYIDPKLIPRFTTEMQGQFSGIGVQIRKNNTRDQLQVVTPILGSPAYKAKIYANDVITTIVREVDSDGKALEKPEVIPTKGMTTEDAVKKILGKTGTKIKIVVEREGADKPLEFNLLRGKVEVESVMGHKRHEDDTWNYVVDPENKICYVRLSQFSVNTHRDLERIMKRLSKEGGIKGFVLDLRFNPGGLLDQAVKISDLFIDDGMIVSIRPRNGPETSYVGKSDGSYTTFPMVCLVNGASASASEIVSAALQDHGRAIVVGSRSYGKGSVQTIHNFYTGGKLKLTTATFWRPNGRNLNRSGTAGKDEDEWGVTPNSGYALKLGIKELNDLSDFQRENEIIHRPGYKPPDSKADFKDRQLEMALEYLRAQIRTAAQAADGGLKKAG
jgi:carboxyl-terminal processing protease